MGRRWLIAQKASVRTIDKQSWASKMGEEDGVGVGQLGTWGLGLGSAKGVGRS